MFEGSREAFGSAARLGPVADLFDGPDPGGDARELHVLQDPSIGLRAVVCIHRTVDGVAAGGIRRMAYEDEAALLADARRLAEAMSLKAATADLDVGGAKVVVWDRADLDVPTAYEAIGEAVDRLGGRVVVGPDVGTGPQEMARVRDATAHANPSGNAPDRATARGVLAGVRGVLRHLDGDDDVTGRRFVVQGLGAVGSRIAADLVEEGADVLGADVDPDRRDAAERMGVGIVDADAALATRCDVFLPCALGGVVDEAVAGKLEARAICGSANNVLASAQAGDRLQEAGVAYAPDFVVNAGALIEGVLTVRHGATDRVRRQAGEAIDAIEERVVDLLATAEETGEPVHRLAERRARERLAERADR